MVRSCTHGVNRSFAVVRTACGRAFWVKMLLGTGLFGLDWTLKARHAVLLLVDSVSLLLACDGLPLAMLVLEL